MSICWLENLRGGGDHLIELGIDGSILKIGYGGKKCRPCCLRLGVVMIAGMNV
jgi:hypothetical protein